MSASLLPECLPAKEKYDACFIRWYTESRLYLQALCSASPLMSIMVYPEFLRGERTEDEACKKLFLEYSHCLKVSDFIICEYHRPPTDKICFNAESTR